MIVIRTAEDMACVLATTPDTQMKELLTAHAERLADYDLEDVAEFVIVQPGDTLDAIEEACQLRLVEGDTFLSPVELITEHALWYEVVWILSDDGFGLVLLVNKAEGTEPQVLAACRTALLDDQPHTPT